jgi:hypothetical protein
MGSRRRFETALVPAFRRVDGVRLIVSDGPLRAEVYGVGHRFPARARVSVALAARLVEAGAVLTVVTLRSTNSLEGVA